MRSTHRAMRRGTPRIERLRSVPLFAPCSRRELTLIASSFTQLDYTAGQTLVSEGGVGREFVVVVAGTASVHVTGRPVVRIGPGGFIGEMALLDRQCRTAAVVAETDLDVEVCGKREFVGLLVGAPTLTRQLLVGLADRLRSLDRQLAS